MVNIGDSHSPARGSIPRIRGHFLLFPCCFDNCRRNCVPRLGSGGFPFGIDQARRASQLPANILNSKAATGCVLLADRVFS